MEIPQLIPILTFVAVVIFGLAFLYMQKKLGSDKATADAININESVIAGFKEQVAQYKDQVAKLREDIQALTQEVGKLQGIIQEKDKQLNILQAVLAGRDPQSTELASKALTFIMTATKDLRDIKTHLKIKQRKEVK